MKSKLPSQTFFVSKLRSKLLLAIIALLLANSAFAQLESDEVAATPVSIGGLKTAYYDKCKGILYVTMQTSQDAANTRPIHKAYVYIKIGTQWKNMLTIRGEDARCCNNTCGTGMSGGINASNTQNPAFNSLVDGSGVNHNEGVCSGAPNVNNISGTLESGHIKRRIGYYNGAASNYSWFSYEDEGICESYNSSLNVVSNAIYMTKYPTPPDLNTGHGSNIQNALLGISVYPASFAWGLQFGVINIPRAAIVGNNIQVRVYVNYRSYQGSWASTAATDNWYETYEYAVSTQVPDAPLSLSATTNQCSQITLNWSNSSQTWSGSLNCANTQTYNNVIYRNGVKIAVVAGTATSYTDNDIALQQRQTYNYAVKTILWNEGDQGFRESSSSNVATGSMLMPPAQPSPFTATDDKCDTKVEMTWSQPSGTAAASYKFMRSITSPFSQTVPATLAASLRAYTDATVTRGQNYMFKLVAVNTCGYASDTAFAQGASPSDPVVATGISQSINATYDTVTVSWTDNANNETKYQVQRTDNLGNVVTFDLNPNTTSYIDNGIVACRSYTYKIKVFNACVQSGLISTGVTTMIIPPPALNTTFNTTTKKLTCSKGYFTNRIELGWQNNNGQNIDLFKIYRKISGSSSDSVLIGTTAGGGGFYVDNTADARVYYKYTLWGVKFCNGTDIYTNATEDIGFRNPTGLVSGHIEYNGGIALNGAKVIIQQAGGATGNSLQFASGATLTMQRADSLNFGNKLRLEFWFKPTAYNASQSIVNKTGVFSFSHTGANYVAIVNVAGVDYTVSVPESNFPLNQWKHVSMQYSGTAAIFKLYANGVVIGSVAAPNGTVKNTVNQIVFGGANSAFLLDEFRLIAATSIDTVINIDHARFLNASASGTRISLHLDEGSGNYAYDGSSQSNVYNANHFVKTTGVSWSSDIPSSGQLSYFGVTDTLGNYTVAGILFGGTGENYTLIPSYLTHSFTPNSRSVFIGDASTVFSNQDFTDNSSFAVSGDLFYKNTTCPVPDGLLKIDGLPVIANGQQAQTDASGNFNIRVPIGNHYITIERYAHDMESARFPITGTYDFQADVAGIHFVDSTRRSIIGRVVGGLVEADKAPGMGRSVNNIGKTRIRISSPITGVPCYTAVVTTDAATGEYKFDVPPLQYKIDSVYVASNPNVLTASINPSPFTNTSSILDLRNALVETKVIDTLYDNIGGVVSIDSVFFHKRHDMIYRITPTIGVTDTLGRRFLGEDSLSFNGTSFNIRPAGAGWGPFGYPVFKQDNSYYAKVTAAEIYTNSDNSSKDTVLLEGKLMVTNGLVDGTDPNSNLDIVDGVAVYSFNCGSPNTATNAVNPNLSYTKDIQMSIVPTGAATVTWKPNIVAEPTTPNYHAYTIGKRVTGTGVATQGPEKVDFILRDPPGSGSSATWATGQTLTKTEEYSLDLTNEVTGTADLSVGTRGSIGIGVETDVDNEISQSLGLAVQVNGGFSKGFTETVSSSYAVSTRDDADNVGATADVFIGRSRNWYVGPTLNIELQDLARCAVTGACFGDTVSGKRMAKMNGYAIAPGESKTRFSYTQNEIETVVIPTLEALRKNYLTTNPKYTLVLTDDTDPKYGSNNDDPIWGASATSTTPFAFEEADTTGLSYIFRGRYANKQDTVRLLNTQISLWKQALAQNEREKMECKNNALAVPIPGLSAPRLLDNFTLGSAIVTNSYTSDDENTTAGYWELSINENAATEFEVNIGGNGVNIEASMSLTQTTRGSYSNTIVNSTSFEYTLTDGDPGDIMSIDVYKTGTGNVFITRGGQTMCPYEDEIVCHYYNPSNPTAPITSHTYSATGFATIAPATVQREVPDIQITPSNQFNIPSGQQAIYQLILTNQSALTINNDIDLRVHVASVSNPFGAIVKIDGLDPNTSYNVPTGASVIKTLTVERGPIEINYDSLMIIFSSNCSDEIADTAYISAHFIPTCTELDITSPSNNFVYNNSINNTANVIVSNYNYNYGAATDNSTVPATLLGLNNIELQFRPANSNQWLTMNTFYKYPGALQDTIPDNQVYTQYLWDISGTPDGSYEMKAVSSCLNKDGSFSKVESPTFAGVMDRINPHPFGTPSPADGILDPNDDIMIQFNEPVDIGSLSNFNFDVRGVLNGGNIRHAECLAFDGASSYAEVAGGVSIQKRDFTFEFWAKANAGGTEQVIISQGSDANQNMTIGFDASDKLKFSFAGNAVTSNGAVGTITSWHHYAVAYDYALQTVSLYVDGSLVNSGNTTLYFDYNGSGRLVFGKALPANADFYAGQLHEVRLWSTNRSIGSIVQNMNNNLGVGTAGLLYNWKMDEAEGIVAKDYIRSRNADLNGASWAINPTGKSVAFDGVDDRIDINSSTLSITKEMDFTLEFWFKSNQAGVATLFSNGKGDGVGSDSLNAWNIQKDAAGQIHIYHKGLDFVAVSSNYFDNSWHHFALVLQRSANLSAYIDGSLQNSVQALSFEQMGAPFMYLGARGYYTGAVANYDNFFAGNIDEFRFWNTARKVEQIKRDKQNRMLGDEFALTAFLPFEDYTVVLGVPILTGGISDVAAGHVAVTAQNGAALSALTPTIKLPRPVQSINYTYSLNNDKIIITPTTSSALIENVTLDVTVKNVYDLRGNKMQSPKTWIAYVNKNQVLWQDAALSFQKTVDSVITFTTQIINSGGASKQYTIGGVPSWLTVSTTNGSIAPNSSQTVSFTIPAGQSIGDYVADLTLTTDFGYDEILSINVKVVGKPPVWNVNSSNFQYSMNIIGQFKIDGVIATSPESKIGAFNNGVLCGTANLQYLPAYDRYEAFLNVNSNNITGDSINFNIYDATTGLIYVNVFPNIMFVENDVVGSTTNPVTFITTTEISKPVNLNTGWTWISLPLYSAQLASSNVLMNSVAATTGDISISISDFDQYDAALGWVGNISQGTGYRNNQSYKVKLAIADTIMLVGTRINPDSSLAQINVSQGWNWIGYPSTKNLPISEALGNYNASNGDLIKSQYQFAYYDAINGWSGSLTHMRPSMGYMLKAATAGAFNYPLSSYIGRYVNPTDGETQSTQSMYPFVPESFENTMTAIVKGNLCDEVLSEGTTALGVFDEDDNLRGYAYPVLNSNNEYIFYLTIYSNANSETLYFKYFNESSAMSVPSNATIAFATDAMSGTPSNPVHADVDPALACNTEMVTAITTTVIENKDLTIYPNPFNDVLTLRFKNGVSCKVELIDMLGKVVYSTQFKNKKEFSINTELSKNNIAAGMYYIQLSGDLNEQVKVIKSK